MRRLPLLATLAIFTVTGLFSQTERAKPQRPPQEQPQQREKADQSAAESLSSAAQKAAAEVGEAFEETEEAVKETLGLAKTGCLTRGDEADPFILEDEESGDRITVVGSSDLPRHVGHKVTIYGSKESDGRVFHAQKIEHVSAACETPIHRSPSASGYERGETRTDTGSSNVPARGVTADDQGLSAADRKTTQAIRKAVSADETLSVYARNAKIITQDGIVTLRGPVRTDAEKRSIEAKAAAVAGAGNVKNELTIEATGASR